MTVHEFSQSSYQGNKKTQKHGAKIKFTRNALVGIVRSHLLPSVLASKFR